MIKHITICLCCILVPLRIVTSVSKEADARAQYVLQEATVVASQGMEQIQTAMQGQTRGLKKTLNNCVQNGIERLAGVVDTAPDRSPDSSY